MRAPCFHYRREILDELADHGLRPRPTSDPERVRQAVSELYRYEIRRLRQRLLRGEVPKREYANHVIALRRRYVVLSIPLTTWTVPVETREPGGGNNSDKLSE